MRWSDHPYGEKSMKRAAGERAAKQARENIKRIFGRASANTTSTHVKRWGLSCDNGMPCFYELTGDESGHEQFWDPEEGHDPAFVLASDYDALAARVDELEEALEEIARLLRRK